MPLVLYPVGKTYSDNLDIPVDPILNIQPEIYYPGLEHHQAISGRDFFVRSALPRWRGTAQWASLFTNSDRANDLEAYFAQIAGGVNIATLPHYLPLIPNPTSGYLTADWSRSAPTVAGQARIGVGNNKPEEKIIKPGMVFKPSTTQNGVRYRILRIVSATPNRVTNPSYFTVNFEPEINIFDGIATSPSDYSIRINNLTETGEDDPRVYRIRATPETSVPLTRTRTLVGPWSMSWREVV